MWSTTREAVPSSAQSGRCRTVRVLNSRRYPSRVGWWIKEGHEVHDTPSSDRCRYGHVWITTRKENTGVLYPVSVCARQYGRQSRSPARSSRAVCLVICCVRSFDLITRPQPRSLHNRNNVIFKICRMMPASLLSSRLLQTVSSSNRLWRTTPLLSHTRYASTSTQLFHGKHGNCLTHGTSFFIVFVYIFGQILLGSSALLIKFVCKSPCMQCNVWFNSFWLIIRYFHLNATRTCCVFSVTVALI